MPAQCRQTHQQPQITKRQSLFRKILRTSITAGSGRIIHCSDNGSHSNLDYHQQSFVLQTLVMDTNPPQFNWTSNEQQVCLLVHDMRAPQQLEPLTLSLSSALPFSMSTGFRTSYTCCGGASLLSPTPMLVNRMNLFTPFFAAASIKLMLPCTSCVAQCCKCMTAWSWGQYKYQAHGSDCAETWKSCMPEGVCLPTRGWQYLLQCICKGALVYSHNACAA